MDYKKLSAELTYLSHCYNEKDLSGIENTQGIIGTVRNSKNAEDPRVIVFLHCNEGADFSDLETDRIRFNSKTGTIRTAILPISEIGSLSEHEDVNRLEASNIMKPCMDRAAAEAGLLEFRSNRNLTGKNVIIGVVDTGIDASHEAFNGRILRIWDQKNLVGDGVNEGDYGREYKRESGDLEDSFDLKGHGTHVAGIAGGAHSVYGGVAPNAEFVIVKTSFNSGHIADAIRYIFRIADELDGGSGRPAVINLSLGNHLDAHDGSDDLSEVIKTEVGRGKIICVAAGNEGSDAIHAQALVLQDHEETIDFRITKQPNDPQLDQGNIHPNDENTEPNATLSLSNGPETSKEKSICLSGWYSGRDTFEFTLTAPTPTGLTVQWQGILEGGENNKRAEDDNCIVVVTTTDTDPVNGKKRFLITIRPKTFSDTTTIHGDWKIRIKGVTVQDGNLDIWLVDESPKVDGEFVSNHANRSMTISSPGCAEHSITAGAYATKLKWSNNDNKEIEGKLLDEIKGRKSSELNHPSKFSSEGPLSNGILKPDVCAPGEFICAPLSGASDCEESFTVSEQTNYRMMRGTSMATPFISGIVALLLEGNKNLTPRAIKLKLKNASKIPGKETGTHDPKWGFGLIDVSRLVDE